MQLRRWIPKESACQARAAAACRWQDFASAEENTIKQTGTIGQSVGFMVTGPTIALLSTAAQLSPLLPRRGSLKVVSLMAVDSRRSVCAIIQRILCCLSCAGVVCENARRDKSGAARRRSNAEGGCGCELRPLVLWLFPELVRVRLNASQLLRRPATRFLSLATTDSAGAPTGSTGEGRIEREDGAADRSAQPPVAGNHAADSSLWSTAVPDVPFPRLPSSGQSRLWRATVEAE